MYMNFAVKCTAYNYMSGRTVHGLFKIAGGAYFERMATQNLLAWLWVSVVLQHQQVTNSAA